MPFTDAERSYLAGQHIGRLATVGPNNAPQARPVSFRVNDDSTIDIGGPANATSRKYRNIQANPEVSFVVDDMTPAEDPHAVKPGWGRGVEIRGRAELVRGRMHIGGDFFSDDLIRIHPHRIISWHIDPNSPDQSAHA
jgi:pyridoxamine 5'-phosphate oxidase family protein